MYIILLIEIISKYKVPTKERQLLKKNKKKEMQFFTFENWDIFHLNSSGA
jgi:hypothetical protein